MLEVNSIEIGIIKKPLIIKEMSASHVGDIELGSRNAVKEAKEADVSAVKMQIYTSDTAGLVKNPKDNNLQNKDFFLGKRISIIAKDAGAANLICHYFKNKEKVIVFSQEPATKIFVEFGFKISNCIKEIIDFGELFIVRTGTSNFEKQIVFEYLLNKKMDTCIRSLDKL